MAWKVLAAARDLTARAVVVGILADVVRLWPWHYPVAPIGVGLGLALGVGNELRGWRRA